uniref:Aminoacyl-transfer RNA synthetases class-II family profile domain-containing protein n=1 Tax=Globisporangium ultimum (strain ATCC 200006 / CBS 805.95 / DAOM BR144) TaxID=431595 RepID=K3WJ49_GLOUD
MLRRLQRVQCSSNALLAGGSRAISSAFRTHTCGDLCADHAQGGERVRLSGWVDAIRPFGPISFISLRDRHGITQLVLEKNLLESADAVISKIRPESVIRVEGVVRARPDNMRNDNLATGAIEVVVDDITELNSCATLPLQVASGSEIASEETRLRHRYLDLRRPTLQQNLLLRSQISLATRNFLCSEGFLEIETPTLFKSTPEGAREFLVPTRTKGQFYALTQSPQQYKQLLMVGGLDRYFQLARCYRDEGGRADRQPEFTQIDLEMSFIKREDIMDVIERLVKEIWKSAGKELPAKPFTRMNFQEAMHRFGVDKPDTRYGLELQDVSDLLQGTTFQPFQQVLEKNGRTKTTPSSKGVVRAINAKGLASQGFSRKDMDELERTAKRLSKNGVFVVKVEANTTWKSSFAKKLTEAEIEQLNARLDAEDGDVLLFAAGEYSSVTALLGRMRTHSSQLLYAKGMLQNELDPANFHHLWVLNFPMFERSEDEDPDQVHEGGKAVLSATHHPFTAPTDEDAVILDEILKSLDDGKKSLLEDPETVEELLNLTAQHYDIVCNGWELGGGSIRIHQGKLQQAVFEEVLELPPLQRQSFEHLLQALSHGAPPHGGIALGLDRLVAILCGAPSLRDVIAFPKSSTGNELMTNAPGPVLTEQLEEYHIQLLQKNEG